MPIQVTKAFGSRYEVNFDGSGAYINAPKMVAGRSFEEFTNNFSEAFGHPIAEVISEFSWLKSMIGASNDE